jgi:signal transduction histidine kinase
MRPYAVALAVGWTTVIVASLGWNLLQMRQDFVERARMEAHGSSDKDLLLQRWVSEHGGVYVPVTEKTPPNPNLAYVEERDIVTPSGRRLTLMNAAYVMRQLYTSGQETHGIRGHFTSLNPIRRENAADPWEASVLHAFERGQGEVSAIAMLDEESYMRFMRPMVTEERCLKCHGEQGYQIGDIRGGFSVSVPMSPYWVQAPARMMPLMLGHGSIWVLGLVGMGFAARSVRWRVSEREQAERALQRQYGFMNEVVDSLTHPFYVIDAEDHRVILANRASGFGDRVGTSTCYALTHGRTEPCDGRDACPLEEVRRTGEPVVVEHIHYDTAGFPRTSEVHGYPVFDDEGNIAQMIEYNLDITERKRAEEERRKLDTRLQAAAKQESLAVLAGGVAHDFNNLLVAILGNADLALAELPPLAPGRDKIADIEKASRRAADLCKQMLAFSGRGHFTVEGLDLSALVNEISHLLEVTISKKAVLECNLAEDVPAIEADTTQIRQIIMNLITNATEAIGDRGGVISISTGAVECDRAYLTETYLDDDLPEGLYSYAEVTDTGCGMDEETRERIFDPFFTTKFTGRGLGLAAVLGIVRGHRGALKVHSEPGRGTTFRVLFPVTDVRAVQRSGEAAQPGALPGSGTVLLVDDEETVRAVGRRMLELSGFAVLTAADGREALRVFTEHRREITCVVLDLTMPQMDGEETLRELRLIQSDVRVVLSSGYDEGEIIGRFRGKGLAGFVQKPYDAATLVAEVGQAMGIELGC